MDIFAKTRAVAALAAALAAGTTFGNDINVSLPTFTYVGRIMTYDRKSVSATSSGAEIRVRRASDNQLLCVSQVVTRNDSFDNYLLEIPLSLEGTQTTIAPGEGIKFELQIGDELFTSPEMFPKELPDTPGKVVRCDIVCGTDKNANGVSDAYESSIEESIAYYREVEGWELAGDDYDPDADYDGDGYSNRKEYLAGTDPFIADDYLRFLSMKKSDEALGAYEFTFFGNSAKTYSITTAEELLSPEYKPIEFRTSPIGKAAPVLNTTKSEFGIVKVYVLPMFEKSEFFKIQAK